MVTSSRAHSRVSPKAAIVASAASAGAVRDSAPVQRLRSDPARRGPGRPRGSRTKRTSTRMSLSGEEGRLGRKGRGSAFSEDEALSLAKAWVEQNGNGYNDGEASMWGGIQAICARKYGVNRTAESLRCAWMRIARETQHFLDAHAEARAQGKDDVSVAMDVYRTRAGKKDADGMFKYAPPFKYVSTAHYLCKQPKFEGEYSSSYATRRGDVDLGSMAELDDADERRHGVCREVSVMTRENGGLGNGDVDATVGLEEVGTIRVEVGDLTGAAKRALCEVDADQGRTVSVKRAKLGDKKRSENSRIGDTLSQISSHMYKANELFAEASMAARDAAYIDEDLRLLELMEKDCPEYDDILNEVLRVRRNRVRASDGNGSTG